MKLLVLCREPRLYSCQRLKQAAEQAGCELDILDPQRFLIDLKQGTARFYYQAGEVYDKQRQAPVLIDDYDGVIGRFGTAGTTIGCHLLAQFEYAGIPTLNRAEAFALARDKWRSLQRLNAEQIPIPTSLHYGALVERRAAVAQSGVPLVIKTLSGAQGVGVMLSESESGAASVLDTLQSANIPCLLQTFVSEAKGRDIRAFVIGDRVVAAMVRQGKSGEFRANIHQGGLAEKITLTEQESALAVRASQALGLDVSGVDILRSENGPLVLEVNAAPGLEMIEKVSQAPIAEKMIAYFLEKISQSGLNNREICKI